MKKNILNDIILQSILQYSYIGIHVIDEERKTIIYNEAMAKIEGLESQNVIDKDLLSIFPSLNEETSTLLSVMKTKEPIINKTQTYLNYKGQKITSVNSTIPIFCKEKIVAALEIAEDVTHIRKLSDQLIDLQNDLVTTNKTKGNIGIRKYKFSDIIGNNDKMKIAVDIGKRASNTISSVLIYGETGSGKELFAQSIHYGGIRRRKPFIAQNCAAIPDTLLEGIFFGTEKGGFTGAIERPGIFEQASGGTLMLDEVNSMPVMLQAKLLRVLQEGYIRRIGGVKDIPIDVRIIATVNEDPDECVKKGLLRKDLYYRLNVVYIKIPPLRERVDDIPVICNYFIDKYNRNLNKDVWIISDDVLNSFYTYSWPGNVRELENVIESAMNYISDDEHTLKKEHFITNSHIFKKYDNPNVLDSMDLSIPLPNLMDNIECKVISSAFEKCNYNVSKTAKKLGIKRQTLQHKIKKYQL
ncbi:PAS domain S-box protein [Acidilutibacter cellobiosedens]|jgi:arginine utilization regulatory protein|uniref:PAS domain S-box protein n=1 Tax=Acidilutibacter cellobiosedens TaxID=2507161 RepID=A0A410QDK5_9FIRM|nr:sigma 54-interacting transcriptional regulator [Acidilutibacter cellobiosedens]QAT62071.1 PAS domain S-box protein [Acidilutibacter cellobiosedens]